MNFLGNSWEHIGGSVSYFLTTNIQIKNKFKNNFPKSISYGEMGKHLFIEQEIIFKIQQKLNM
jgi:hypothetical protein